MHHDGAKGVPHADWDGTGDYRPNQIATTIAAKASR